MCSLVMPTYRAIKALGLRACHLLDVADLRRGDPVCDVLAQVVGGALDDRSGHRLGGQHDLVGVGDERGIEADDLAGAVASDDDVD